ncbi:MAG TPA: hypothetical protein V6C89_04055 [Drouetiella sp.]|jgi:hypothetical protein
MIKAFLSRFIPGFEAACTRLRLNYGKPKDVFADIRFLIDHYVRRGELDRADALSCSLVALAEGDAVRWTDPELFPGRKSIRYRKHAFRKSLTVTMLLLMPILALSQHQFLLTLMAKDKMRHGNVREALSLLRSELALESAYSKPDLSVSLTLADALICDYQLPEALSIISSVRHLNPRNERAIYLDLQCAMLTGQGQRANQDALMIPGYMKKKELISSLLMSNVLNGHGPYTDFETMLQLSGTEQGLAGYKLFKNSQPENETDQKFAAAMGYFCKANNDEDTAARWFKQSMTLARGSKFKSDQVRFVDSVNQYVSLIGHKKPIEARRLEWTAMGIANQNRIPYESFEQKSAQEELSLLQ